MFDRLIYLMVGLFTIVVTWQSGWLQTSQHRLGGYGCLALGIGLVWLGLRRSRRI